MAQTTASTQGKPDRRSPGQIARLILPYAVLILLTVVFIAPLLWMLSTSLKPNFQTTQFPPNWIPQDFSGEGYSTILTTPSENPVLRPFINSLVAATAHAALVLVTASPAASPPPRLPR